MSNFIISDPDIMMGKPVIKGTRITVELILQKLAAKQSFEDILADYPSLTLDELYAACDFASRIMKADAIYPHEASKMLIVAQGIIYL
ncbi:MAG: DUF433 domain-containing protein [Candidatus Zixiibacteriota bacterium]